MTVPKLRFKEFSGDWISENIQGLVDSKILDKPMDGNHGEIHPTSADYVDDGIPFVMATDIFNGQVYLNKSKKIPKTQADSLRKGFSLEGDILLTHKATIGNVAIVPKLNTPYVMLTPQVTYYRILNKEKLVPEFLKSNFESPYFQNELLALCTGATRLYIGISEQRKIPFRYCCTEEQTKIASFLSAVDEKISQLNQKHRLLCDYKQGMMQKLFSQQLRFKADDGSKFGEWEETTLGEIGIFLKGKGIPKADIVENGLTPCIRYGELYTHYGEVISKVISATNVEIQNLVLSKANDVLIPASGETQIDIATASCVLKGEIALSGDLNIFRTEENGIFLSYLIRSHLKMQIAQLAQGNSVVHLYSSQLKGVQLNLPCLEEQTKIANFLSAIDQKIEIVAQQIQQAKMWKKGLLQQMFV